MIKAVDLFCGVGGLTNGFIKSGIHVVSGIDLDRSCKFAYEYNNVNSNGKHVNFINASVSEIDSKDIQNMLKGSNFSILAGCAPCQPFSNLQKDKSNRDSDYKWGLLYDFLHHIQNILPDIVSMENVPTLEKEIVFKDFVKGIKSLGYYVNYKIINAAEYGVPQRRRRLLLLASRISHIDFIAPTHIGNFLTVRDVIGYLPELKAGEQDKSDPLHLCSKLSELNLERIKESKPGGSWRDWNEDLLLECYKRSSGRTYSSVYGRMEWDKVSPTLTTQFGMYGTGRFGHPEQNRAISLREGAIIQTFPISYKFTAETKFSKTVIARQIGNAVPVRLGEVIGKSILEHLSKVSSNNNGGEV